MENFLKMMLPDSDPNCKTVSTLVFMDLEATGLPSYVGKRNVHITELSLVAIDRSDFESDSSLRVLNKLNLCIRPRTTISPTAMTITGLYNDILEKQEKFDESIPKLLEYFFRRLRRPLCLLAHNGNRYDFPLLQAELRHINYELDGEILCADTLEAFRSIVSNTTVDVDPVLNPNNEKQQNDEVAPNMLENTSKNERIAISEDETDKMLSDDLDLFISLEVPEMENTTENKNVSSEVMPFPDEFTTPTSKNTETIAIKRPRKKFKQDPSWTPKRQYQTTTSTKPNPTQIKRQLFANRTSETNTVYSKPTQFSLEKLYYHYFGESPPKSHYAEADCIALSKVCQKISADFLKWIDAHSTSFNETPAMW
ncbi:three-prime repair exonuclease 1-like [Argiope bruennichi]|uniref:Three prime repair exonuclease 2 like protein n=1 Tax=Argiope bruennichi TaxID=94029 RepID=A0A8T0FS24_ARGBR|nr:three-prime repair exonuclease 1-like [Argiope bruennichi]KAF8792489.1 Three prime repair exonuclease 2 like protein [Argiope bruennichi]